MTETDVMMLAKIVREIGNLNYLSKNINADNVGDYMEWLSADERAGVLAAVQSAILEKLAEHKKLLASY